MDKIWVRGEDVSMTGGLLDRGASRGGTQGGQREEAGEYSVPDSEGMVFEAGCGCSENTEEFQVRCRK